MGFRKLVVGAPELLACGVVFALAVGVELAEALDLVLVLDLLFLELRHLEQQRVNVLPDLVPLISLMRHVPLQPAYVNLLARYLIPRRAQVLLHVAHDARLLVKQEAQVVHFLLQAHYGHLVRIVLKAEVIVLEELFHIRLG